MTFLEINFFLFEGKEEGGARRKNLHFALHCTYVRHGTKIVEEYHTCLLSYLRVSLVMMANEIRDSSTTFSDQ